MPRRHITLRQAHWITALVAAVASAMASAEGPPESRALDGVIERAQSSPTLPEAGRGLSIAIDNDLFAPTGNDRDYTGGVGLTLSGPQTADYWWSLDPLLGPIDRVLLADRAAHGDSSIQHAVQVGYLSFTPQDLRAEQINFADRPYASLLFVTSARHYLAPDANSIRFSGLTLGALGLSFADNLQREVHHIVGGDEPRGYDHQISSGGEPTARYVTGGSRLGAQRLALGSRLLETKTTWELSAGYLTEASYSFAVRLGTINSPWWTFNPERVDYIAQPAPVARRAGLSELYVWAGAKARLRAYNAFLQGQFRDSDHRFAASELNHAIGELWIGITGQFFGGTQMSYAVRYQTAEIRHGIGSRDPVWAGVTISHSF